MGRIRVGLSGWNYDRWRGEFYPKGLPRRSELSFASEKVDTIEINGTFYGLSKPQNFQRWREATPPGFLFAVKGSRFITHNKKLSNLGSALANFLASGVLDLGEKLGPILWQLSAGLHFDAERIDNFLSDLPKDTDHAREIAAQHDDRVVDVSYGRGDNHRLRHALEVRHESYLCYEMATLAKRHGVALAFSHSSKWPYLEQITAGFVYVRLHGPGKLYASAYGEKGLESWAERMEAWRSGRQPLDARVFSDVEPPPRKERDVYVYFDNDEHGYAPREAVALRELIHLH